MSARYYICLAHVWQVPSELCLFFNLSPKRQSRLNNIIESEAPKLTKKKLHSLSNTRRVERLVVQFSIYSSVGFKYMKRKLFHIFRKGSTNEMLHGILCNNSNAAKTHTLHTILHAYMPTYMHSSLVMRLIVLKLSSP